MTQTDPASSKETAKEQEIGSVFVSNYPPYSVWSGEAIAEAQSALNRPPIEGRDLGLYLHIPFCRKRCKFCYFRVYTDKNFDEIGSYLDALAREVEMHSERPAIAGRKPRFVYFGGGTPSYISAKHLKALVARLQNAISWDAAEEVAFECEPGTLTAAKLQAIREIGVTRLSLGIENYDDDILRLNGRAHASHEIGRCLPWIRDLGFDQLNVDLIAGMLGETWTKWKQTVARTIAVDADSVTIYQLELPYNTRFTKNILDGELEVPVADWDLKREWHAYAIEEFAKAGYETSSAYTLVKANASNRAQFLYRDSVWHGCDLLGAGVASFSHVSDVHFQNCDGWGEYLARIGQGELPIHRAYSTQADERLTREFILQLKFGRLESKALSKKFGVDVLARFAEPLGRLEKEGWLKVSDGAVDLTSAGLLRADSLLPNFYEDRFRNARYT